MADRIVVPKLDGWVLVAPTDKIVTVKLDGWTLVVPQPRRIHWRTARVAYPHP